VLSYIVRGWEKGERSGRKEKEVRERRERAGERWKRR
jgi:hypothetical protein